MNGSRVRVVVVALVITPLLSVALAWGAGTGSASAASVGPEAKLAKAALARAVSQAGSGHFGKARKSLAKVRGHATRANRAARALIGAPPTDPESDDPPGPPAVAAAIRLDARLVIGVTGLYAGSSGHRKYVTALGSTLKIVQVRREPMIDEVIALPPEGSGADYADGMSDVLPLFSKEVSALTTAHENDHVSDRARTALAHGLARAKRAKAEMNGAFGGGE